MDFTDSLTTVENVLFDEVEQGRTLIQNHVHKNWPKLRSRYCGDQCDLEQALVVGLLEWRKEHPGEERFSQNELTKVLKRTLIEEYRRSFRSESLGAPVEGEDGDWSHWNPQQPDDALSDEQGKLLSAVMVGAAQLVGEVEWYVVKAHVMHGMSFAQIARTIDQQSRLVKQLQRERDQLAATPITFRETQQLGFPNFRGYYKVDQLECMYHVAIKQLEEAAAGGKWVSYKKWKQSFKVKKKGE